MNNLFSALVNVIRKHRPSRSNIVPFSVGKIYQCAYRNWKHDPRPTLLILGSNAFYTVGLNIHYLGAWSNSLQTQIMYFRQSGRVMTGLTVFQVIKQRTPMILKLSFRKYFTSLLRGKLVSEGISTIPEVNLNEFLAEPWVKRLNKLIRPQVVNKVVYNPKDSSVLRDQVVQTQYSGNSQKPFSNRTVVQYRPQMPNIPTPSDGESL